MNGTPPPGTMRPRASFGLAALAALAAVAAHLPALANGFTNWDDDHYLTINPLVLQFTPDHVWRFFSSFQLSNYHPLTLTVHALWHSVFGLAPLPHHALNLALHAVNAALVFLLAGALGAGRAGALAAALLFAAHPLQVETVAWVAQLKTLLATLFLLLSLLAYLRRTAAPAARFPAAALLFAILSLLAKPAAVPLPIVLVLMDRLRGRALDRRALAEKAPFVLVALVVGALTLLAQQTAMRPAAEQPPSHGPFVAAHGVLFLLAKAAAPLGLSALYPYPAATAGDLPWTFLVSPLVLGFVAFAVWRLGRRSGDTLFGALFFLTMLAPTLQLIPVGFAHTADRYFYIPSIGLFFAVGGLIERRLGRGGPGSRRRTVGAALLLVAVTALGAMNWRRAAVWRDGVTLWRDVAARYPAFFLAWGNLGQALADRGDVGRALPAFSRALELNGDGFASAKIFFDRALAWQAAGKQDRAVADYTRGLAIHPGNTRVLVNRGNALDALGRPREALEDYALAIAGDPEYALAWYNQGVTLAALGDHAAALASFDRSLRLDPGYPPGYRQRAMALQALGKPAEAAADLSRAARLESGLSSR